jgi:hypothetical protein
MSRQENLSVIVWVVGAAWVADTFVVAVVTAAVEVPEVTAGLAAREALGALARDAP